MDSISLHDRLQVKFLHPDETPANRIEDKSLNTYFLKDLCFNKNGKTVLSIVVFSFNACLHEAK